MEWPAPLGREVLAPFYAGLILTVQDRAPLLVSPRLARLALEALRTCPAPGQLWACSVLPTAARLVVGPVPTDTALASYIARAKAQTEAALLPAIRAADDESLDMVLRYNPVWRGAIYRVWAPGCHRERYWTGAPLSNALATLRHAPVKAGLAARPEDWPFLWLAG